MKKKNKLVINWIPKKTKLEDLRITKNFKDLLVEEDGKEYILFSNIDKIMVESGGSPFDNCFTYSTSNPSDRWFFNKVELMRYMDIEDENYFDWEDGWNYMDRGGWFNWKDIGCKIEILTNNQFGIEYKSNKYDEILIPIDWILNQIDFITKYDYCILFTTDDWYSDICNQHFTEN